MNAQRVVHAISRIGYSSYSAIMDIVDNSITANAKKVHIQIERHEDKFISDKYSAKKYTIIDNGKGMDNEGIINALTLGSKSDYPPLSLSKYGMGLKSAGLSLGTKIHVVSKQKGKFAKAYTIDTETIEDEYFIVEEDLSKDEISFYDDLLQNSAHGTIIEISGCEKVENYSIATTIKHLNKKMGVVYSEFFQQEKPLEITIHDSSKLFTVLPHDILFLSEAYATYDHELYDCKLPCITVDTEVPILVHYNGEEQIKNAQLKVVIFPKKEMGSYPGFTEEERKKIKSFEVSSENSGFFIYRNHRLIRWGENFAGVYERKYGFRAKLNIYTEHDDVLHVDVSKQRLHLSEEVEKQIQKLIRPALKIHDEIFEKCSSLNDDQLEGEEISNRIEDYNPIDPDEYTKPISPKDIEERKKRRAKFIDKKQEEEKEAQNDDESEKGEQEEIQETIEESFKKVRYSYKVKSEYLWRTYSDTYNGYFIVINQNHTFYQDVMSRFPEKSPERQSLEFLLFSFAVAEGITIEHLSVDDEVIEKVLDKYARVMSSNLSALISDNRDLFDK